MTYPSTVVVKETRLSDVSTHPLYPNLPCGTVVRVLLLTCVYLYVVNVSGSLDVCYCPTNKCVCGTVSGPQTENSGLEE